MIVITLPWPDRALWPNSYRPHWTAKAKATKAARLQSWALALEALKGRQWPSKAAQLAWEFHPKTKRTPDRTNCIISTKAWEDGIADALGVNDRDFEATYRIAEPVKGGKVVVTIVPSNPKRKGNEI